MSLVFRDLDHNERVMLTNHPKFSAGGYSHVFRERDKMDAMLDQLNQAAETLRDCWLERTGLAIEDDPYVEDACSAIESVRAERMNHD